MKEYFIIIIYICLIINYENPFNIIIYNIYNDIS